VKKTMHKNNIRITPGKSWIEVDGTVYSFLPGDKSHEKSEEIYAEIEKLSQQLKQ